MLEEKYRRELREIVDKHVDTSTWHPVIFGSRANGRAARFSDIDLGFHGDKPIPLIVLSNLREDIEESDIPYVVDIVDLNSTDPLFRKIAEHSMAAL